MVSTIKGGMQNETCKEKESRIDLGDGEMPEKVKPSFSENATRVLERRYLLKDEKGSPTETPEEMLWRVARAVAKAEERFDDEQSPEYWAERFYEVMAQLDFCPTLPR